MQFSNPQMSLANKVFQYNEISPGKEKPILYVSERWVNCNGNRPSVNYVFSDHNIINHFNSNKMNPILLKAQEKLDQVKQKVLNSEEKQDSFVMDTEIKPDDLISPIKMTTYPPSNPKTTTENNSEVKKRYSPPAKKSSQVNLQVNAISITAKNALSSKAKIDKTIGEKTIENTDKKTPSKKFQGKNSPKGMGKTLNVNPSSFRVPSVRNLNNKRASLQQQSEVSFTKEKEAIKNSFENDL